MIGNIHENVQILNFAISPCEHLLCLAVSPPLLQEHCYGFSDEWKIPFKEKKKHNF